jgi:type I restriction enzyme M protein
VETYRKRKEIEKYSRAAPFAEIQENEFNLNIPRYVDTFEPEPEIDIPAVQKEIAGLEKKLETIRAKMDSYLKELGYSKR